MFAQTLTDCCTNTPKYDWFLSKMCVLNKTLTIITQISIKKKDSYKKLHSLGISPCVLPGKPHIINDELTIHYKLAFH